MHTALGSGRGLGFLEAWLLLSLTSRERLEPRAQAQDLFCIYTLSLSDLIRFLDSK